MQSQDKPLLLRRRPAVVALTVERHGGEGERILIGEELGGLVLVKVSQSLTK
jgi:hypothetical protein